jgi:hypothetical protein
MVAVGAGLYAVSLALTTLALLVAGWVAPGALLAELGAILAANALAAIVRFSVLRAWIFRPLLVPAPLTVASR